MSPKRANDAFFRRTIRTRVGPGGDIVGVNEGGVRGGRINRERFSIHRMCKRERAGVHSPFFRFSKGDSTHRNTSLKIPTDEFGIAKLG